MAGLAEVRAKASPSLTASFGGGAARGGTQAALGDVMRSLLPHVLPVLALAAMCGCSQPTPAEDVASDDDAISHEEAAKGYAFTEKVFDNYPAAAALTKIGVSSWAAYSVSDPKMVGLALFAVDPEGDVRYVMLVNSHRTGEGTANMAISGRTRPSPNWRSDSMVNPHVSRRRLHHHRPRDLGATT